MTTSESATATTPYDALVAELRAAATIESVGRALAWDQETMLPAKGAAHRADQLTLLSGLHHERMTSERLGDLLAAAEQDVSLAADESVQASLREIRRDYDHNRKLPRELVEEMTRTSSLGMDAWKAARSASDFSRFEPWLAKTIELNRRKSECLGIPEGGEAYDPLLDVFEPGTTAAEVEAIFEPLHEYTVQLVDRVATAPEHPDVAPATRELPVDAQRRFVRRVLEQLGFDFEAGRIDDSTHPFCEGMAPGDTRLTNRLRPDGWCDALSSGMHEGGHGLYEQGLPKGERFGTPLAEAVSLGIHESQSRLWENLVGRSPEFWLWAFPVAEEIFGAPALEGLTPDSICTAVNVVRPSFIRVEADEVTYNLHVTLRFAIERALMRGELAAGDVPGVWNDRMLHDFGLTVPEDRVGCLQDIHWSMGMIGYFPTYTLGNLYASQIWEAMAEDLPDRSAQMTRGEFGPILAWLRENVHRHGKRYRAPELCQLVTGKPLEVGPLERHLEAKVQAVYGV